MTQDTEQFFNVYRAILAIMNNDYNTLIDLSDYTDKYFWRDKNIWKEVIKTLNKDMFEFILVYSENFHPSKIDGIEFYEYLRICNFNIFQCT